MGSLAQSPARSAEQPTQLPAIVVQPEAKPKPKPKRHTAPANREKRPQTQAASPSRVPSEIALTPTFGTTVENTTAGPVLGYRPLDSQSATKTGTPLSETPQSVQVIPRKVIEDQGAISIQDVAKSVAGVTGAFGFFGVNNGCLRVRGFSTEQGSVGCTYYLDGVRVWAQPIPLAAAERLEIVKGPNSVLFGRNEPGGIVNVITRQADFGQTINTVEQRLGSFNTSWTSVDVGGAINDSKTMAYRINAAYTATDTFRDRVFDNLGNVQAAFAVKPAEGTRLDLIVNYADQVFRPDFGIPALGNRPAPVPIQQSYKQDYVDSETESTSVRLKLDQKLGENWRLNASYFYSYMEPNYFNVYGCCLNETTGKLVVGHFAEQYSWRASNQVNVDLKGDVNILGLRHKPLFGYDYNRERYDGPFFAFNGSPDLDLFHPEIGSATHILPARADFTPFGSIQKWHGFYAQDQVHLTDWLIVNGGFRHDIATFAFSPDPFRDAVTETSTTPRVGVVVKAWPGVNLFAQYQEGFAPGNGRSADGAQLPGETAVEYETGVKWTSPNQALSASLALFNLRKQHVQTHDPNSPPDAPVSIAVGEVRNRGIEFDLTGQLTQKLSILGSYAYSDAVITKDFSGFQGNAYEGVPRHAGSLWLRYQWDEKWAFGGGIFAEGERPGDLGNTFALPGYARVDLMGQYRFLIDKTRWTAQLNVNNVFDTQYYAGVWKNSRDFILPGAPRAAYLTLRANF
jgi:iron complex outermembrane receptor protein